MDRRALLTGAVTALTLRPADARPRLHAEVRDGVVSVRDGTVEVLRYAITPLAGPEGTKPLYARSGYIAALRNPEGALVTDDFPPDHPHQRGVFFAWTKTKIVLDRQPLEPDFWNLGSGTGRVRCEKATALNDEAKPPGFKAQHVWEARKGDAWVPVLDEAWEVTVDHRPGGNGLQSHYLLDLTSRQRPKVDLELPQYRYGGMCVRGPRGWVGLKSAMKVLTSEGKERATTDDTTARWVAAWGPAGGGPAEKLCGYALLEHPSNPGAPNRLRFPPEYTYAVFSPPKAASLTLEAGKEHVFRHRVLAYSGAPDRDALDRLWKEWTV